MNKNGPEYRFSDNRHVSNTPELGFGGNKTFLNQCEPKTSSLKVLMDANHEYQSRDERFRDKFLSIWEFGGKRNPSQTSKLSFLNLV